MKFGDIIGIFKESNKITKSHMKNLFEMAMVDSHFDDSEFQLLKQLAKKHKVSEKELEKIQADPSLVEFEVPKNPDVKFEQFYELVHMMTIDDEIFEAELNLCRIFAKKFGYENGKEIVDIIAQNISNGLDCKESRKRVAMYYKV
ncbi:MAG: hypothetical protein ABFS32_13545 [Bacteroidota bacterium]